MKKYLLLSMLFISSFAVFAQKKSGTTQPLENTYWQLMWLGGSGKSVVQGFYDLYVEFTYGSSSIQGFGGCNRFSGSYLLKDKRGITITGLISTKKYCADMIQQEQMFMQALEAADAYKVKGKKLSLYAGTRLVATFVAAPVRMQMPME
jgi:heat shock protein HslJ